MERRKMLLKMVIAAMIIFSASAHAIWSPDWQVEFTDELDSGGGCLTTASAMGDALLARLPAAGVTFEIED